ncbi:MAG TPA: hypothetical protein VJA21_29825, partial [Verrucomicrobiae bacterium]
PLGLGIDGSHVGALAVSGSNLYAGGWFTGAGGNAANNIAMWNGSAWSALGSGISGRVLALAVSGTDLYAGGLFTTAGGSPANYIAKWDGSAWSPLGLGMDSCVNALAVSGSCLYAGGFFTNAGGRVVNYIAKWDGSAWSALGSGMGGSPPYPPYVYALAVSGPDLYAGGWFTEAGGRAANYIAKWNGSAWSPLGSGMDNRVNALAVLGPELYAGGDFTAAGGKVSGFMARAIAIPGDWLRIREGVPGPGTNTLNYVGVPNAQYLVQFATNLTSSPWITLATNTVAADGRGTLMDCTATNAQRFYRVGTP